MERCWRGWRFEGWRPPLVFGAVLSVVGFGAAAVGVDESDEAAGVDELAALGASVDSGAGAGVSGFASPLGVAVDSGVATLAGVCPHPPRPGPLTGPRGCVWFGFWLKPPCWPGPEGARVWCWLLFGPRFGPRLFGYERCAGRCELEKVDDELGFAPAGGAGEPLGGGGVAVEVEVVGREAGTGAPEVGRALFWRYAKLKPVRVEH